MLEQEKYFYCDKPIEKQNCCDVIIVFIKRVAISFTSLEVLTPYSFMFIQVLRESNLHDAIYHVKTRKLHSNTPHNFTLEQEKYF